MATATDGNVATYPTEEALASFGDAVEEAPPTLQEILTYYQDYKLYYQPFHNACKQADDFYFGRHAVPAPEGADVSRPATPRAIVNVATDHVDVNNLSIDVPLASPRAKARAERLRKFYHGVWLSIKTPVKRTAVNHAFRYGLAWLKQLWASEMWPDAPRMDAFGDPETEEFDAQGYKEALEDWQQRRQIAFPFRVEVVNPQNLIWDDSRAGTKWVIEFYQSTVGDVRRKYPEWSSDKAPSDKLEWLEYWDAHWYAYIADGTWVRRPTRHGYGALNYKPVIPARSGDYEHGKPEDRYESILKPVYSLIQAEARLVTQYEAIVRKYAWGTLDFIGPPSSVQQTIDAYQQFGGLNAILPGVEVKPAQLPTPPQEILSLLTLVQNEIEMATFPNVVRGLRPKGVSSGFGISVLAGMGRLVFQDVADAMSRAIEQLNSGFAMMVENKARGNVTVHARTEVHDFDQVVGPDDIRGYYENIVSLKAEAPEERERESLLAFRLWNGGQGIISMEEAMRRCGIVNPLEEMNQILTEDLLRQMQPSRLQQALQQLATSQASQQAAAAGSTGAIGTQFLPGQAQLQRPGEAAIQRQRIGSRGANPSVFPQGLEGIDQLGRQLGLSAGGAVPMPSGERVA